MSDWAEDARCLPINGRPPSGVNFFAEDAAGEQAAVQFCGPCPVKAQCLQEQQAWELRLSRTIQLSGVFGGKTAAEREAMRKEHFDVTR